MVKNMHFPAFMNLERGFYKARRGGKCDDEGASGERIAEIFLRLSVTAAPS